MFDRAAWTRQVIGAGREHLTAAQKVVLIALSTFADYRDGTNARPGIDLLAGLCNLTSNAVGTALGRGRLLGLIERTELANRGGGKSDVYRLTLTPIAVGSTSPLTPTTVGVTAADYPNGHDPITPTATTRLPQRPLGPPVQDQHKTREGERQPGTSPAPAPGTPAPDQSANSKPATPVPTPPGNDPPEEDPGPFREAAPADAAPPRAWVMGPHGPRCRKHANDPNPPGCWRCRDAGKEAAAAAEAAHAARTADLAAIRSEIDACTRCDRNGLTHGDKPRRCTNHRQLADARPAA